MIEIGKRLLYSVKIVVFGQKKMPRGHPKTQFQQKPQIFNKSLKFSNLSKEEWTAHQNLKTRDDIVIKPADKGGAVVVWRTDLYKQEAFRQLADTKFYAKVNKDLTQANQKIVKDTVNKLILEQNCPQQPVIFSSPRLKHLHFTSNRKSTNLTTPVARSFLPAVAQQNSFPAF